MPVPVQSELEPMGKYFLIRAMHIDVNGVRLDNVINEVKSSIESIKTDYYTKQQADDKFAAKTDVYTKSEVDIALSGKVSVQSGYGLISDAEKAQIQTNKSGIAAAETAIAGKASTEAVAQLQTDMSVQTARMDQLVGTVPAGSADEIADARVTVDGKTEANLGNAIRSQVTSLKETIVAVTGCEAINPTAYGKAINVATSPVNPNPVASGTVEYCAIVPCSKGDSFTISGLGGSTNVLYTFVDASYNIIIKARSGLEIDNFYIAAPDNAAYLIINNRSNKICYRGMYISEKMNLMLPYEKVHSFVDNGSALTTTKVYIPQSTIIPRGKKAILRIRCASYFAGRSFDLFLLKKVKTRTHADESVTNTYDVLFQTTHEMTKDYDTVDYNVSATDDDIYIGIRSNQAIWSESDESKKEIYDVCSKNTSSGLYVTDKFEMTGLSFELYLDDAISNEPNKDFPRILDRIVKYGLNPYPVGRSGLNTDPAADIKKVYYVSTATHNNYKDIMYYDGTEFVYFYDLNYDDLYEYHGITSYASEYNIENDIVKEYLGNTSYDGTDYSYTNVLNYSEAGTSYPKYQPNPYIAEWSADAAADSYVITIAVNGDYSDAVSYTVSADNTEYNVYNARPDCDLRYKIQKVVSGEMTVIESKLVTVAGQERMIAVDGVHNVRDIGGWKSSLGGVVKYGKIIRGAAIDETGSTITALGIKTLHDQVGIRTEIDLRGGSGISTSVIGSDVEKASFTGHSYTDGFADTENATLIFTKMFDCINADKNIYIHCSGGCDRTEFYVAMLEGLLGVSEEDINKDFELSSFAKLSLTNNYRRYRNMGEEYGTIRDWAGLMAAIKGLSGATFTEKFETYFKNLGFNETQIESVRTAMLKK